MIINVFQHYSLQSQILYAEHVLQLAQAAVLRLIMWLGSKFNNTLPRIQYARSHACTSAEAEVQLSTLLISPIMFTSRPPSAADRDCSTMLLAPRVRLTTAASCGAQAMSLRCVSSRLPSQSAATLHSIAAPAHQLGPRTYTSMLSRGMRLPCRQQH